MFLQSVLARRKHVPSRAHARARMRTRGTVTWFVALTRVKCSHSAVEQWSLRLAVDSSWQMTSLLPCLTAGDISEYVNRVSKTNSGRSVATRVQRDGTSTGLA